MADAMNGPLAGVRVLEMGAYTTGPLCARFLSNLGAEVIKVEPLRGELVRALAYKVAGNSYIYYVHNYNKRGVALDTGTEAGRTVLYDLAAKVDVLIENFAFGTMEKWGFGETALRAVNPGLIYCSCTGFGQTGPQRELRALDTVIQGMGGVMSLTGQPGGPPTKCGLSAADAMGATASVMAILGALLHKRRTGRGQRIDISMHDVMGWMTAPVWGALGAGGAAGPDGSRHIALAPQNLYRAADGLLVVEVETGPELQALLRLAGAADLAAGLTPETAKSQEAALDARIQAWAETQGVAAAVAACIAAGVPAAPVQGMAEIAEHPLTRERAMLVAMDHPGAGPIELLGSPFKLSRTPGIVATPAPAVGQDTRAVLRDLLAYDSAQIDALAASGAIGVAASTKAN
ncbi:MAG: CaiB/BaiF CoA transferase family protein [Alphaproteobacteria bacterium]